MVSKDLDASAHGRRFFTVAQWVETHSWPTASGLRWLIFNRERNGFNAVIRRAGRSVVIGEREFYAWLDKHGTEAVPVDPKSKRQK